MLVSPCGRVLVTGDGGVVGWVVGWPSAGSVGVGVMVVPPGAMLVCAVNVIPWVETTPVPDSDPAPQAGSRCASGDHGGDGRSRATMTTKTPASAVRSDFSVDSDIGRHDT